MEAGTEVQFFLVYEELLVRRLGKYNLFLNVNPGQIVDDLSIVVKIQESRPLRSIHVPDIKTSNLIPISKHAKTFNSVASIRRPSPTQVG
jgi:hypothetical protein